MKKFVTTVLSALLLAGCSSSNTTTTTEPTTTAGMTPGTYSATATGYKGDISVDVTVTEDAISAIEVTAQQETDGIGADAIEILTEKVLEHQTTGVDNVTGATVSSAGFKAAVRDALEQAGADMSVYGKSVEKGELPEETIDADVVVVGAGASGMTAALYAAKSGLDVVLLEKTPLVGGASAMAGGTLAGVSSTWSQELGYTGTLEEYKEKLLTIGHNQNDIPTVDKYLSIMGPGVDWIVSEDGANMPYKKEGSGETFSIDGSGVGAMQMLKERVEAAGANLMLSTKATELIVTDGTVTGVKAEGEDATYTINAKAVILATGGYGHNSELVPEEYKEFNYSGHAGHDGDALTLIEAVDGATRHLYWLNKQPNSMILPSGAPQYTNMGVGKVYNMSGILINQDGVRFYCENGDTWELMEAMAQNERQYLLMDQENYDAFNEAMSRIYSAEDVAEWTSDDYTGQPFYKKGETVEELAEKLDVPADALQATIDKYNEAVNSGSEDEFGRVLTTTIAEEGPYYALEMSIRYSTSLGGICIDDNMQVVNTNNEAVPGLYAAGEVVGGVQGDLYLPSSTFTWAMTSGVEAGRIVSEALAE